jgi:hypothetical protein
MNDNELHALEFQLRRLRPRASSEFFEARLEAALETRRPRAGFPLLRAMAAAGFAAGVAWLAALSPEMSAVDRVALRPLAAEEVLQSARDEGLVTLDDGTTAQRLRLRYLETLSWSGDGRTLTLMAQREELRLVPVTAY